METRIRNATKEAQTVGIPCGCRLWTAATDCRSCLGREVCVRLQSAGFNAAICKTKWRSSSYMPSGEHTFMDVVGDSASPKKGEVRVVIELNLRAEFVIARACDDYDRLVQRLPEVYVGKEERLQGVIKILRWR
ncbi:Protein SCAR (Protein WAVE) [Psidium guajava]|nr:Protein SCAR (Protein WAVE) [Psidium guajava]